MSKPKSSPTCHPDLPHMAKGLCAKCYHRSKYAENPTRYREAKNNRRRIKSKSRLEVTMLCRARERAKKRNIPFNLTLEDINIPKICPILGIALEPGSSTITSYYSPSLDRIDNSKGYIKGNVVVISWRANRLKGDGTIDELKKIVNFYSALQ